MPSFRLLAALVTLVGLLAVPATASASTTYTLSGIEVNPSPATFVGSLVGRPGTWKAIVQHDPLSYTGTTTIRGGSFTITTFLPFLQATGAIDDGGTIVAGPVSGGFACSQTFSLTGTLNAQTGSFAGTLTHYGFLFGGRCNAVSASFTGVATL